MNNRNASKPMIAPSHGSNSVDRDECIQGVDRLILGKNTVLLFLDKYPAQFCFQLTLEQNIFYHLDNVGEIELDKTVFIVGSEKQINEDEEALRARLRKIGFIEAPIFKPYDSNIHSGTMAGYMDWVEKLKQDKRVIELEKWLLLPSTENGKGKPVPIDLSPYREQAAGESDHAKKEKPINPKADPENPEDDNESERKSKQQIAVERICEAFNDTLAYHWEQRQFRQWTGKYWAVCDSEPFKQQVIAILDKSNIAYTDSFVNGCISLLRAKVTVRKWIASDRQGSVNFDNGVLDIATGKLREHNPNDWFTSVLPYAYNQLSSNNLDTLGLLSELCPNTYQFFSEAMGGDDKKILKLLAVINGIVKYRFSVLQMFVYITGKPASGKGTFLRLLQEIVGKDNHQATRISKLNDDYHLATVIDKQLVTCSDEDKYKGLYAVLKALTGGDTLSYRQIYSLPASSPFYGTLVAAANEDIFSGVTTGLERRICHVEMNNSVASHKRDHLLDEKLKAEISNLLPIALSMDDTLVRDLIKGVGEGKIASFEASKWLNKVSSDSVADWLENNVVFGAECKARIGKKDDNNEFLYSNYATFCSGVGSNACSLKEFSKRVLDHCEHLGKSVEKKREISGFMILGLRVRSEADQDLTISENFESFEKMQVYPTYPTYPLPCKDSDSTLNPTLTESTLHTLHETEHESIQDDSTLMQDDSTFMQDNVECHVELKPLPDIENVGYVGLKRENSQKPKLVQTGDKVMFILHDKATPIEGVVSVADDSRNTVTVTDLKGKTHNFVNRVNVIPIID